MRRKFYAGGITALLLAAMALASCGADVGIVGGEDGPVNIYVGDNVISLGGDDEDVPDMPAEEDKDVPEAPPSGGQDPGTTDEEAVYEDQASLDEDGTYNSAEDVSLYLYTYGCLPENYITKKEARELGWSGGSVEQVAPGCAIGGDTFGNREGVLPDGNYHECDIDTIGQSSRGAKRLVYADDGRIYYTEDHYETFTLLYGEE